MLAVHSGQRSTSHKTENTVSGGALISTAALNRVVLTLVLHGPGWFVDFEGGLPCIRRRAGLALGRRRFALPKVRHAAGRGFVPTGISVVIAREIFADFHDG